MTDELHFGCCSFKLFGGGRLSATASNPRCDNAFESKRNAPEAQRISLAKPGDGADRKFMHPDSPLTALYPQLTGAVNESAMAAFDSGDFNADVVCRGRSAGIFPFAT
jgi:hypothetical protein